MDIYSIWPEYKKPNPRIHCADGFSISVQGSVSTYCQPRENYPENGYTHYEVAFPSAQLPSSWDQYSDQYGLEHDLKWGDEIWCYVPASLVLALIESHGGIVKGQLPTTTREDSLLKD